MSRSFVDMLPAACANVDHQNDKSKKKSAGDGGYLVTSGLENFWG